MRTKNKEKEREAIRAHLARSSDRSSLFWWLLENHDWILEEADGRRLMWIELCPKFAEMGLTDRTGKPALPKTAKLTWERVRKERARVDARRAAEEEERAAKRAANPRRNMPSQWRGTYGPALAEESSVRSRAMASTSMEVVPARQRGSTIEPWEEEGLTDEERHNLKTQLLGLRAAFRRTDKHNTPKPNKRV
jgi:hypothetical protein